MSPDASAESGLATGDAIASGAVDVSAGQAAVAAVNVSLVADAPLVRKRRFNVGDRLLRGGTGAAATIVVLAFATILLILAWKGSAALRAFGFGFLTSSEWSTSSDSYGALAYVYGTIASSIIALLVAIPIATATAIALVDLLPRWLANIIGLLVELLAAVPSIVYGIWAITTIAPFVRNLAALAGEDVPGQSLLAGGLVLAVMILPILTAVSRDMLRAVPVAQREAALAMGATRWEVTKSVVLPNARGGLIGAALLGLGRAIGETMAVLLVIGSTQPLLSANPFHAATTIAALIASRLGEANGLQFSSLVALGLILMLLSLALNLAARAITNRLARRLGGSL